MRELLFMAANGAAGIALNPGINVTVRKGTKWADANLGERVIITETETGTVCDTADILGVGFFGKFEDIPDSLIAFEHESKCRSHAGLAEVMKDTYGESWDEEGFTVLVFWVGRGL